MLLSIGIVLFILWALCFFVFHVVTGIIHLLLVLAVIAVVWHFVKGRSTTPV